jgi:hypothetical protein
MKFDSMNSCDLPSGRLWGDNEHPVPSNRQKHGVLSQVSWLEIGSLDALIEETLDSLEATELKMELASLGLSFRDEEWSALKTWEDMVTALERWPTRFHYGGVTLHSDVLLELQSTDSQISAFNLKTGHIWTSA